MRATPKGMMLNAMLEAGLLSHPGDNQKFEDFCNIWKTSCLQDGFDVFDELSRIQTGKQLEHAENRLNQREASLSGFVLGILCCLIVNGIKAFFFG